MATIVGVGLLAGLLIGSIGIGGVIVVPALTYLAGIDIHRAIAAALMSFSLSGLVGTLRFRQFGIIDWSSGCILAAAAVPGTIAGTIVSLHVSAGVLKFAVAIAVFVAGLQSIFARTDATTEVPRTVSTHALASIGAFVAFASVLTGTGGPLLLVPILIWRQQPILKAVGLSQVIQLPISLIATMTNFRLGALDIRQAAILAAALGVGTWCGASIVHQLPTNPVRLGISYLLVTVGTCIIVDAAIGFYR